jgi:P4 family phage/plasmid primase-like protien
MPLSDAEMLEAAGIRLVPGFDGEVMDLREFAPPIPPRTVSELPEIEHLSPARFARGDDAEIASMLSRAFLGDHIVYTAGDLWQYQPDRRGWYRLTDERLLSWCSVMAGAAVFKGKTKDGEIVTRPLQMNAGRARGAVALVKAASHHDESRGDYWNHTLPGYPRGIAQFADRAVVVTQTGSGTLAIKVETPHPDHRVRAPRVLPCAWPGLPDLDRFADDCPLTWQTAWDWWGHHGEDEARARMLAILEFIGASVLGMAPAMSKAVLLYGPGGTGKSTLIELMTRWCKPEAVCSVTPQDMGDNRFASARLDGAVLNVIDDLPAEPISDAGDWKSAVTGGRIDVERKGRDGYGIFPRAGHLYAGNRLPVAIKANSGFWRRWLIVEYDKVFADTSDARDVLTPMMGEMDRIVAHAVAAFMSTGGRGGRGYTKPACHRRVMREWEHVSDSVSAFTAECLRAPPVDASRVAHPPRHEVYRDYRTWCGEQGRHPVARGAFEARVADAGFERHRTGGVRRWACSVLVDP